MHSILAIAFVLVAILALVAFIASRPRGHQLRALANVAEGFWPGKKTYLTDAAVAARYLLGKIGSDADHVALAGAADEPIGVITDEAAAAEDPVNLDLFGMGCETKLMVASEAIAAGEHVFTAANGKVQNEPAGAGTFWLVGKALSAAAGDNALVVVAPVKPLKVVVIAALASTNGTAAAQAPAALTSTDGVAAAAADLAALKAEAELIGDDVRALHAKYTLLVAEVEKIGDDVRAIGAATAAPALVKTLA